MTPADLALVLLLTWLAVTIIDWLLAPVPQRRPIVIVIVLLLSLLWVYGVPVVIAKRGG